MQPFFPVDHLLPHGVWCNISARFVYPWIDGSIKVEWRGWAMRPLEIRWQATACTSELKFAGLLITTRHSFTKTKASTWLCHSNAFLLGKWRLGRQLVLRSAFCVLIFWHIVIVMNQSTHDACHIQEHETQLTVFTRCNVYVWLTKPFFSVLFSVSVLPWFYIDKPTRKFL